LEGVLSSEELEENRADRPTDTVKYKFRDDDYYMTKYFNLADIEVPVLSVANWVRVPHYRATTCLFSSPGWNPSTSARKCARLSWGGVEAQIFSSHNRSSRHSVYYEQEVEIQKSFLDAFLKGEIIEGGQYLEKSFQ